MLERLTRWENNDKDVADLIEEKSDFDGLTEAINRLAEYEDSGLPPEEVQKLAKEKARIESATHYVYAIDEEAKEILGLIDAKAEGRFIVLSLKKQKNVRNAT